MNTALRGRPAMVPREVLMRAGGRQPGERELADERMVRLALYGRDRPAQGGDAARLPVLTRPRDQSHRRA